ncbi:MAG: DUF4126 domain-containing protein [Phycisphaerales bacterium]|nr:DUF4126 domain-containing protein [Phycisphaerales bacterium]
MTADSWTVLLSLIMGVALAAACGFRVFLPLFILSLMVAANKAQVSAGFAWLGDWPALLMLGTATVLEIIAYYVPWLDNMLDAVASPAALVAGTLVSAAFITGMDPMLKWTLAAILGGGAAGAVQMVTVSTRAVSSATTGGVANPVVSTFEWMGALLTSLLAILLPIIAVIVFVLVLALVGTWLLRHRRAHPAALRTAPVTTPTPIA